MQRHVLGFFVVVGTMAACTMGSFAQSGSGDGAAKPAGQENAGAKQKQYRPETVKKFDANGDGRLDESEVAAMEEARAARKAKLKEYDTNKDGKLDDQERAALREAEKAKRQAAKKAEKQAAKAGKSKEAKSEESGKDLTFDDLEQKNKGKKLAHDEIMQELAADEDDTIVLPSVNVDQNYIIKDDTKDKDGHTTFTDPWKYTLKFAGQYTFGGPKQNDWGLRMTVPLAYNSPGNYTDYATKSARKKHDTYGFGDISIKLKRAFGITRDLRSSLSLKAQFPTAKEGLGQDQYQLQPEAVFSYKMSKTYTGLLTLGYLHGFARFNDQPKAGKTSTSSDMDSYSIKPQINIALPYKCLFTVNYKASWKIKDGDTTFLDSAKIKLSKRIGKLNTGLGFQKAFKDEDYYDSQIDLTCSYNF